jgi:hypothetical protein
MPTKTFRPKWKERPQSKKLPGKLPPLFRNTLLDELMRLAKLPISKGTSPLGEPVDPVLVAERLRVEAGQNQSERKPVQSGMIVSSNLCEIFEVGKIGANLPNWI